MTAARSVSRTSRSTSVKTAAILPRAVGAGWFRVRSPAARPVARAATRIPRVLHQVYGLWDEPGPLPTNFAHWASGWRRLHPDWNYVLWSGDDVRRLVADEPSDVQRAFHALPRGAQRSDLARYLILQRHGGIYADLDVECIRNLEPVMRGRPDASAVLFAEGSMGWAVAWKRPADAAKSILPLHVPRIGNFAMASVPGSEVLAAIIELVVSRASSADATDADVLHMTGPEAVTEAVHRYRRKARDAFVLPVRRTARYMHHRCTNTWVRGQDVLAPEARV